MTFAIQCKPAGFARYCRDARAVVLEVGELLNLKPDCLLKCTSGPVRH